MRDDRDLARLRAAYADLLEPGVDDELVRFVGDLEALHTAPALPPAARAALARSHADTRATRPGRLRPVQRWWAGTAEAVGGGVIVAVSLGIIAVLALVLGGGFLSAATGGSPPAGLLYPGTLEGRAGIVATGPDGGDARLLAEGRYTGVAASPDGRRFLAYGAADSATPEAPVALYDAAGGLLRRYALGTVTPLAAHWAPDGRRVALVARPGVSDARGERGRRTWLLDEQGARELALGASTAVATNPATPAWSARGRLLLDVADDRDVDGWVTMAEHELWTVDASGGDARRLYRGPAVPLGWSSGGGAVYVVADFTRDATGQAVSGPRRVLALDERTGAERTVAVAEEVARQLGLLSPVDGASPAAHSFGPSYALALAPAGDRFALWLVPGGGRGDQYTVEAYLAILDEGGRVIARDRAEPGTTPSLTTWSPDGARLAYGYIANGGGAFAGIRVVTIKSTARPPAWAVYTATAGGAWVDGDSARWSPDGRRLAFLRAGRVEVAMGAGADDARILPGTGAGWPSWRPIAKP